MMILTSFSLMIAAADAWSLPKQVHIPTCAVIEEAEVGGPSTAYRFRALMRVKKNDPEIAKLAKEYDMTLMDEADLCVELYIKQVAQTSPKANAQMVMGGIGDYEYQSDKGEQLQVVIRSDDDFHAGDRERFSIWVNTPGG
jgi:hypothetical protein